MKFRRQAQSPIDDQLAEADIQDRLQLANTLRQRSMEGASLDNVGGHLIGSPWARALSSAAQGIQGAGERKRAYTMATDLATSKRERLAQALGGAGQDRSPDGMIEFGTRLLNDPATADVGQFYIQAGQKAKERAAAREAEAARWQHQDQTAEDRFNRSEASADRRATAALEQQRQAADARLAAIQARPAAQGHGGAQMPGAGTLYPTGKGYIGRKPDGSWGYVTVEGGDTPIPGAYDPVTKEAVSGAGASGKEGGLAEARLADYEAALPHLEQVVTDLSALGKKATYTLAGQAWDSAKRQLGMDVGEGATARVEYMKKVDNEVLPLLRQTFGAQFTLQEGRDLRTTLGDPDLSPAEKDAALVAFIDAQRAKIETATRRVQANKAPHAAPTPAAPTAPPADYSHLSDEQLLQQLGGQP